MKWVLESGLFLVLWLPARGLLADEQPADAGIGASTRPPTVLDVESAPATSQPTKRAAQRVDPDVPVQPMVRPSLTLPPNPKAGPGDGSLVAAEILLGSLGATGIGLVGYLGVSQSSNLLEVGGIAVFLAGPVVVGQIVCAIGESSSEYTGGCGPTIGFSYMGLILVPLAGAITAHRQPLEGDLDFGGSPHTYTYSSAALFVGYIGGVALGATLGWNIWKRRKDELITLYPIGRASPPPAALADWVEPNMRSAALGTMGTQWLEIPLFACAF